MAERVTANLPARDFGETESFYKSLGFGVVFRNEGWMILSRGPLEIEFFPYPDLQPPQCRFSACIRVEDVNNLHADWADLGLPRRGIPRMTDPVDETWGFRIFALIDPNGNLLRCLSPLAK